MTPIIGIRGELGRFPLKIKATVTQIKYWNRLTNLPNNHILNCALKESMSINSNWAKHIKEVLAMNDLENRSPHHNSNNVALFTKDVST